MKSVTAAGYVLSHARYGSKPMTYHLPIAAAQEQSSAEHLLMISGNQYRHAYSAGPVSLYVPLALIPLG